MKLIRFGVSIPKSLSKKFDELIKNRKYSSRSEAIRDLIRKELVQEEIDQNVEAAGQAVKKTCASMYQAADKSGCRLAHEQLSDDLARPRGGLSAKVRERVLMSIENAGTD